jgi:hypothetical protein
MLIAGQTKDIQNAKLQSDIGAEVVAGIYVNKCGLGSGFIAKTLGNTILTYQMSQSNGSGNTKISLQNHPKKLGVSSFIFQKRGEIHPPLV